MDFVWADWDRRRASWAGEDLAVVVELEEDDEVDEEDMGEREESDDWRRTWRARRAVYGDSVLRSGSSML